MATDDGHVYPAPVTYRKKMSRLVRDLASSETPALLQLKTYDDDTAYALFSRVTDRTYSMTIVRMERHGKDKVRLVRHHSLTAYIACDANGHPIQERWELMQSRLRHESPYSLNHVSWMPPE